MDPDKMQAEDTSDKSEMDSDQEDMDKEEILQKQKYTIPISEATCRKMDQLVGTYINIEPQEVKVDPSLIPITKEEEALIEWGKIKTQLGYLTLEKF